MFDDIGCDPLDQLGVIVARKLPAISHFYGAKFAVGAKVYEWDEAKSP